MEYPHNGAEASTGDRDEVLRKMGRNVLLFQQAELWLKWLAARKKISGLSNEFGDAAAKMREQVAGETLGTAMRRVIDTSEICAHEQAKVEATVIEKGCVHLEIGFDFTDASGEPDGALREKLEALVEHRNDLVHHFLERFNLETQDGCQMASKYLEQQHSRHAPLVEDLRCRCEAISELMNIHLAVLKQDEKLTELLHEHLRLRLEDVLRHVVEEKARADGWTYLSLAGKELADKDPALLKHLEEAFGHRGLKQAVAATGGWRLRAEPAGGGGTRLLYRFAESDHSVE